MSEARLGLIRFVTARHAELRGLHTAVFGLTMIATMALAPRLPVVVSPRAAMGVICVGLVAFPQAMQGVVGRWYDRRCGRVGTQHVPRPYAPWMLLACGVALDLSPAAPFAGRSGFLFTLAGYGAFVAFRDAPFRTHYLAALALPVFAPPLTNGPDILPYFPQYFAGAAWFVAAGLADHWRLVSCMRRLDVPAATPESSA